MISSLTGLELANASLLDGASAAAEGVLFAYGVCKKKSAQTVVDSGCYEHVISVVRTRCRP